MLIWLALILFSSVSNAKEEVVFSTSLSEDHEVFALAEEMLKVISSRIGEQIKLISIPGKRSALLLKNHQIHAELARISEYAEKVPFAIKVSEPVIELSRYVYSIDHDFAVKGWASLKPYHAVTVRGSWIINIYMKEHRISKVDSMSSAFQFLKSGRADVFVSNSILADKFLAETELELSGIVRLEPAVHLSKEFTFFAEGYIDLAARYEAALRSMKDDGSYQAILAKM